MNKIQVLPSQVPQMEFHLRGLLPFQSHHLQAQIELQRRKSQNCKLDSTFLASIFEVFEKHQKKGKFKTLIQFRSSSILIFSSILSWKSFEEDEKAFINPLIYCLTFKLLLLFIRELS